MHSKLPPTLVLKIPNALYSKAECGHLMLGRLGLVGIVLKEVMFRPARIVVLHLTGADFLVRKGALKHV